MGKSKNKPKKGPKKPMRYAPVLLILLALGSISQAAEVHKGTVALGAGYSTAGTLSDYKTVRDSGYSGSLEYWTTDKASLLFEAEKLKSGNIYEASYVPKVGSVFVPLGVTYMDPNSFDPEYGLHAGLGINFLAEKFLGLQIQAKYHYLLDQIGGEDQFLSASGTLRIRFR